jgi:glycerophosphoryl diester phosphodiesterase
VSALRLAHRGDWRRGPENTLPALLAALEVPGCDGVEFDVQAAADGTPVLYHDDTLDRVHGVAARVDDLTADELAGHGIPTLEEVLSALPRRAFLDVELKGDPGRAAVDVLTAGRGPRLERAVVSSFESGTLERVGRLAPSWPRWLNAEDLTDATIALAQRMDCRGISADWRAINRSSIERAGEAGLQVAAWTVRRRPTYRRLEALGVVAICAEAAALDGGGGAA